MEKINENFKNVLKEEDWQELRIRYNDTPGTPYLDKNSAYVTSYRHLIVDLIATDLNPHRFVMWFGKFVTYS